MINSKRKIFALVMAVVMFAAAQTVTGLTGIPRMGMPMSSDGTDWVALYYAENGGVSSTSETSSASKVYPYANIKKAIKDYAAVNADVIGWLTIPNTNMNFPITLNTENKNSYYLYRDWRGNNYAGQLNWQNWYNFPDTATFLDYRTKLKTSWTSSSYNMVLYGHNWNNLRTPLGIGNYDNFTMFAQLPSYTDINFATKNAHIYFSTGDMEGIWRVFAAGYCTISPYFFYNNPNPSKDQRQFLIDEWREYSQFDFNVDVNTDDRLLTLTTCTRQYGSSDTQRYVVVARLLREGESESDVVTATVNKDYKRPDFSLPTSI